MFIVIDSTDGGGSTIQTKMLVDRLVSEGKDVVSTRQPTSGAIGQLLRKALQHEVTLDSIASQLLFSADRKQNCADTIEPAVEAGKIVVCDRYELSTAYYLTAGQIQAWTCGCGSPVSAPIERDDGACSNCGDYSLERIGRMVDTALDWNSSATRPDITFILSVSADVAKQRRDARGGKEELFDATAFQNRVCALYSATDRISLGSLHDYDAVTIDGHGTPEEVHDSIWRRLRDCYSELELVR